MIKNSHFYLFSTVMGLVVVGLIIALVICFTSKKSETFEQDSSLQGGGKSFSDAGESDSGKTDAFDTTPKCCPSTQVATDSSGCCPSNFPIFYKNAEGKNSCCDKAIVMDRFGNSVCCSGTDKFDSDRKLCCGSDYIPTGPTS